MKHGKDNRLDGILASYGADPARWPADVRAMASDLASAAVREAREIDRVLDLATVPRLPDGATARLFERIDGSPQTNVVLFRPRPRRTGGWFRYAAALPLAASLALGIYLGAAGSLDFMLPISVTGDVATADDTVDDLGGVGDADAYAEENLT